MLELLIPQSPVWLDWRKSRQRTGVGLVLNTACWCKPKAVISIGLGSQANFEAGVMLAL